MISVVSAGERSTDSGLPLASKRLDWRRLGASLDTSQAGRRSGHYRVCGIPIRVEIPLTFAQSPVVDRPEIKFFVPLPDIFDEMAATVSTSDADGWYQHIRCADGSDYLRWPDQFEFLVSPAGDLVACRLLAGASLESFETYTLGHALSYAILKRGYEPLHATAVVAHGRAVGLLGGSGMGKSTLAAACVQVGHRILTDDMLVIRDADGRMVGCSGPPRIKLFPHVARALLPELALGAPMNPFTEKLIIPLGPDQSHEGEVPLSSFCVLEAADDTRTSVRAEPMSRADALLGLLRATFNRRVRNPARLRRQFSLARALATRIRVSRVIYPRTLDDIDRVREAILATIDGTGS